MRLSIRLASLGFIASAALSTPAQAQLTLASLNCNNMNAVSLMGAVACAGSFTGNNLNQQNAVLAQLATSFNPSYTGAGSTWSYVNDPSFTGGPTGHVSFTSPLSGYFAVSLMSANNFSLYLFYAAPNPTSGFNFTDLGTALNKKGIIQDLSHASLYAVDDQLDLTSTTVAPEPASLVLLGSGLIGIGFAVRRRRRA